MSYRFKGDKVIINGNQVVLKEVALPVTPVINEIIVDAADHKYKVWNGTRWIILGDASDIVFDNSTNGFTSNDVQSAIEEADSNNTNARVSISLLNNSTVTNNAWIGYSELIPSNTTPVVLPWNCQMTNISFANTTSSIEGIFEIYKNGLLVANRIYQWQFTNSPSYRYITLTLNFIAGDRLSFKWIDQGDNPSDAVWVLFFTLS